ncbi:TetR/AcrR family transcriptional regulator [Mycolicibacterium rufum]|uniref:TetR/AcrR family transcriptional regulator n=1 Tax=Mycolicibacterium rufum TaxID=318424 RepID=A0A9X3BIG6_9MYCO|nr:TetR/AcrR family transcriptional regulator [Mycolicibacterium rufum]KGI66409.1 TetR family transcriptional regulator [Mycolicibacterium rufum]MCV7072084.1 TetR/AcrR family transcriptional regulator [Mycolicibacterium rufum]ULP37173.1 TetR/AcrR family transcriptional regulator [Mycolicibacterium rufum]
MSSRDRILDAYADLLAEEGERFATVDAVAARAGVSKGGVLYHFPSKDQLAAAVCDRLAVLAAEDAEVMRTAAEGPARYYVRSSHYEGTPLDRVLVAVSRLRQAGDARARAAIEAAAGEWLTILHDAIGDLDTARAVKLIGDGLYYNALHRALGGQPAPSAADEGLLAVIDRMIASAAGP